MKSLLLAAGLAVTSPAMAAPAMMEPLPLPVARTLGNSLHYRSTDGAFDMVIFGTADHHYEATVQAKDPAGHPLNLRMTGNWAVEGDRLCRHQTTPPPQAGRETICEPFAGYPALGESRRDAATGLTLSLHAGRWIETQPPVQP